MSQGKKSIKLKIRVKSNDEVFRPMVSIKRTKKPVGIKVDSHNTNTAKTKSKSDQDDSSKVSKLSDSIKRSEEKSPKATGWKKWRSRLGTAVVSVVAICAVVLVGLRLAGFRTFTVMSGSMEPIYPVGSFIYVKPVDYRNLKEGDVISFVADDEKTIVTHRIAGIEIDDEDTWRFRTKGDANSSPDAKLVHYKNVLGTPIVTIPFIGYVAHNIQQPPGIYITLVAGTLLLAWTFLPGTLEERRKLRETV